MIQGTNIVLRPAVLGDRRAIYNWLALSDITAEMMGPPRFPELPVPSWEEFLEDYTPQYFTDADPDRGRSFIIVAQGTPVGHINYNDIDRTTQTVELDIWLAGSRYCHQGYGTDAINTLCRYLAGQLGCQVFVLAPSARNPAAIKAYAKCGFTPTSEHLPHFVPDYYDTVVMIRRAAP